MITQNYHINITEIDHLYVNVIHHIILPCYHGKVQIITISSVILLLSSGYIISITRMSRTFKTVTYELSYTSQWNTIIPGIYICFALSKKVKFLLFLFSLSPSFPFCFPNCSFSTPSQSEYVCFKIGHHYTALATLELAMWTRLVPNLEWALTLFSELDCQALPLLLCWPTFT